jgi:tRNA pseudouridine38-40 synthase
MFLSFEGTNYHGWQIQPGVATVQQTVEHTLGLILGEKISATGAGRTDAGVHAAMFCIHFNSSRDDIDLDKNLIYRLNRFLPRDIAIKSVRKVVPGASARFSATSRTYKYHILKTKDPFRERWSWHINHYLDIQMMNTACGILKEYTDFTSFSRLHSDSKTNICSIISAQWTEKDGQTIFTITSNRFLRNMARAITGTMVDLGSGRTDIDGFRTIIESKDRCKAGRSAPARGLFLTGIEYPGDIFITSE